MKTLPLIGLLAACCAISTVWAAEAPPAQPAAAESAAPKGDEDPQAKDQKPKETGQGGEEKQAAGKPKATAADKAGDKASPQRFVPSEQVRADFDVSFPIDI